MAGYSVSNQVFAVCDQVSKGLLQEPVSGLLGLGFQTIAASKAMPLWQTLVTSGAWESPLMSFQLTRLVGFYFYYFYQVLRDPFFFFFADSPPFFFFLSVVQLYQFDVYTDRSSWRLILDG